MFEKTTGTVGLTQQLMDAAIAERAGRMQFWAEQAADLRSMRDHLSAKAEADARAFADLGRTLHDQIDTAINRARAQAADADGQMLKWIENQLRNTAERLDMEEGTPARCKTTYPPAPVIQAASILAGDSLKQPARADAETSGAVN